MRSIEVFDQIRKMSKRTLNRQQRLLLSELGGALSMSQNELLVLLAELENRGLLKIHHGAVVTVSLTQYGAELKDPPGGMESEER
jgi:DNA-binding MarR family transcriptional regulator